MPPASSLQRSGWGLQGLGIVMWRRDGGQAPRSRSRLTASRKAKQEYCQCIKDIRDTGRGQLRKVKERGPSYGAGPSGAFELIVPRATVHSGVLRQNPASF